MGGPPCTCTEPGVSVRGRGPCRGPCWQHTHGRACAPIYSIAGTRPHTRMGGHNTCVRHRCVHIYRERVERAGHSQLGGRYCYCCPHTHTATHPAAMGAVARGAAPTPVHLPPACCCHLFLLDRPLGPTLQSKSPRSRALLFANANNARFCRVACLMLQRRSRHLIQLCALCEVE